MVTDVVALVVVVQVVEPLTQYLMVYPAAPATAAQEMTADVVVMEETATPVGVPHEGGIQFGMDVSVPPNVA